MKRKLYTRHCDFCGQPYTGRGKNFCSVACRQKHRNTVANPSKTDEAKAKISAKMTGNSNCQGRVLSEETKRKIAGSLSGMTQSPDVIAKKVAGWRKTAEAHGGMTPAHREQLASLHRPGPESQNWRGGTSYYRTRAYFRDPRYKPFIRSVLERDGFACTECGKTGGKLEVHHVLPYASNPDLAFDPANVLTLCLSCHNKTKKGQPRPRRIANSERT